MKRYSHCGLVAVVAIGLWSIEAAEARPRHRGGEGLRAQLNLSDEQKVQLQSFRENVRVELDGIRAQVKDGSLSREEARSSRHDLLQSRRQEHQAIFTADQLEQLQQLRAERAESDRPHRGRRAGGEHQPPPGLLGQLELSPDQQESLEALRLGHRAAVKDLRESGERSRDSFRAVREQHRSKVQEILTATQLEQLRELKVERRAQFEEEGGRRHGRRGWRRGPGGHHPPPAEAAGDGPSTVTEAAATGSPATAVDSESWGVVKKKATEGD